MRYYREVEGVAVNDAGFRKAKISVRISDDKIGKSLSLADDKGGIMLMIPLEGLADVLEVKK